MLLDLKLPSVHGITVLRMIRVTPALTSIPGVVFTRSAQEAEKNTTIARRIEEYVIKPMDIQQFIKTMCGLASRFIKH